MKCSQCNEEHQLLQPAFLRPTAVVGMPRDDRALRVKESDDFCIIRPWMEERTERFFIRCVMPVTVRDLAEGTAWGLWAELEQGDFETTLLHWRDPDQAKVPPFNGRLANTIRHYPETLGLPVSVQLTGLKTRPALQFDASVGHPLAAEVRAGVTIHRVDEWLKGLSA